LHSCFVQHDRDVGARTITHRAFNLLKVTLTVEMAFGCAGVIVPFIQNGWRNNFQLQFLVEC
jgi:hypothetical protein